MFAVSPCLNFAFTSADLSDGIAHVRPATVIELAESAEIVPRASLFSGRVSDGLQPPAELSSTAEPPAVPPPSLPLVKPVAAAKPADRFAISFALGSCARPTARPAMFPWS